MASLNTSIRRLLRAANREDGFALMYMAVVLVSLLLISGLAVDTGQAYIVKAQLGKAVDGAALAAARNLNNSTNTSTSNGSGNGNGNGNGNSNRHANTNSYGNRYSHRDGYRYSNINTDTNTYPYSDGESDHGGWNQVRQVLERHGNHPRHCHLQSRQPWQDQGCEAA